MNQLKAFLIVVFIILGISIQAQNDVFEYRFEYDANGNRVQRNIIHITKRESLIANNNIDESNNTSEDEILDRAKIPVIKFNNLDAIVYPNPTKGQLIIELLNFDEVNNGMILISDMQGRVIFSQKKIDKRTAIDLSNQPAGNYLLRINANKLQKEWTILKQ